MVRLSTIFHSLVGFSLTATALPSSTNRTLEETITCDVCIIGGGSSGTYAAIRLKDAGKHVVVVERNSLLGGHTETFYLPDGRHVDYGVEGVFNDQVSRDYFTRLGVKWKKLVPLNKRTDYVDFTTGERVNPPTGILETVVATILYRTAIKQYTFLDKGVYDLPDPVPEDLLRPFGEFVKQRSLEAAIQMVFFFAQNVGNLLEMPTLYALQNFGVPHVDALVQGYITPFNGMYELYRKAGAILGSDVLFQTMVAEMKRSDSGVELTVEHENGTRKLIKAKKLLITIPPTMEKVRDFDLDETETGLFKKWFWRTYYIAVLNNTGLPDAIYVSNADPGTGPGNLPRMPFDYLLQYMGVPGYPTSKIVGDMNFTAEEAKQLVLSDFCRMKSKATYPIEDPHIVVFGDHSPETLMVTPEEIHNGYYRKLYALQGKRSTYYTGLSFCSDYSSLIWAYTDTVVESMG
ncbi:NADPH-dependent FMN reductase Lot6 [Aspergillus ellipticus CBS 707.79]|uniref:NADPH-dependent FMN reductase Lot6 n=1 Tax=Aspergillus ellipticus CBS 707.79 TaxID=1448320 RepID=A0A319DST3_9EURO|nr:NADPH-dependent FMN reductase Lot6 [Aspergillus ellipticus CBS 707.79]